MPEHFTENFIQIELKKTKKPIKLAVDLGDVVIDKRGSESAEMPPMRWAMDSLRQAVDELGVQNVIIVSRVKDDKVKKKLRTG